MCNLYSITTNQAAIIALFRVINRYVGNLPPIPGVFPDYPARVTRASAGMTYSECSSPALRRNSAAVAFPNASSPFRARRHRCAPLVEAGNRCLVPANSFAEYAPEPNPEIKKKDVVWFALH